MLQPDVQNNRKQENCSSKQMAPCWTGIFGHKAFHIAILAVLTLLCFGRTLKSYFLADDFGEVDYVSQIFAGNWNMFWSNFTGNYMQVPSMSVYRPCLLMTLMADFMLWRTNAFGYYATNLLYFLGDVILVYLLVRTLTANWTPLRSALTGFFSACLFALSPLHCESISWVVGRVDSACCFYYLASLLLFVHAYNNQAKWKTALAIFFYCIALLIKEMAIGLPVLIAVYGFFAGRLDDNDSEFVPLSFIDKLKQAWRFSRPLWITTAGYFVVRYLALGTLLGGYGGAIGASQSLAALLRWTDPDTIRRFFFPLNFSLYEKNDFYWKLLLVVYSLYFAVISVRLLAGKIPYKWFSFMLIWLLTAAAPIYKLWGIGYNLEGARFYFFLTIPIYILLPVLVMMPSKDNLPSKLENKLVVVGALAFLLNCFVFYKVAYATNLLWVHAGTTVKNVQKSALALATQKDSQISERKTLVLGVPKEHGGTHMILNGYTFSSLLNKPFVNEDWANKFITFEPVLYSPSQFINSERFKNVMASKQISGPWIWMPEQNSFVLSQLAAKVEQSETLELMPKSVVANGFTVLPFTENRAAVRYADGRIEAENVKDGDGLVIGNLNINPLAYDFLEFEYNIEKPGNIIANCSGICFQFAANWLGSNNETNAILNISAPLASQFCHLPESNNQWHSVRIPLSNAWRWYSAGQIKKISLLLPSCKSVQIKNMRILGAAKCRPMITFTDNKSWYNQNGIIPVEQFKEMTIEISSIPGAQGFILEVSKPNFFFVNLNNDQLDHMEDMIGQKKTFNSLKATIAAKTLNFHNNGYYEIRAKAINKQGNPIQEYSSSLVIEKK